MKNTSFCIPQHRTNSPRFNSIKKALAESMNVNALDKIEALIKQFFVNPLGAEPYVVTDPREGFQNMVYDIEVNVGDSEIIVYAYTTENASENDKKILGYIITTLIKELKAMPEIKSVNKTKTDEAYSVIVKLISDEDDSQVKTEKPEELTSKTIEVIKGEPIAEELKESINFGGKNADIVLTPAVVKSRVVSQQAVIIKLEAGESNTLTESLGAKRAESLFESIFKSIPRASFEDSSDQLLKDLASDGCVIVRAPEKADSLYSWASNIKTLFESIGLTVDLRMNADTSEHDFEVIPAAPMG